MPDITLTIPEEVLATFIERMTVARQEVLQLGMSNVFKVREVFEQIIDATLDLVGAPSGEQPKTPAARARTTQVTRAPARPAAPVTMTAAEAVQALAKVGITAEITPPTGLGGPPAAPGGGT